MDELVRDVMTRGIISVEEAKPVFDAAKVMVDMGVGSLLVVGPEGPVGYVTPKDILAFVIKEGDLKRTPVGEICNPEIVTLETDQPIQSALSIIAEEGVKHVFVKENGKMVGVFSIYNILDLDRPWVTRVVKG